MIPMVKCICPKIEGEERDAISNLCRDRHEAKLFRRKEEENQ